uniref:Uncharacterized protein n=1 Tax=viral metagenome TaxID=1070528 RepID=A0A6C0K4B7_9ZZZZ
MEESSPLDELLTNLEESLVKLLQSIRGDPWSLLIFQTLIWSFRRWAVHYLISEDMDTNMHDYLWESHIELVKDHAPEGLKDFGVVWLSPANLGDRVDSLNELNSYFLFIVDKLNNAIESGNEDEQNLLAIFLDETITDILTEWLEDRTEYRIYPDHTESSEVFPPEKIFTIMQNILEKNRIPQKETVLPPPTRPLENTGFLHVPIYVPEPPVVASTPLVPELTPPVVASTPLVPELTPPVVASTPLVPEPPPPVVASTPLVPEPPTIVFEPLAQKPLHITIAAALKRQKTLRLRGRRAESNKPLITAATRKRRFIRPN